MLYIAIVLAVAGPLSVGLAVGLLLRHAVQLERAHARREDLLVNQLCALAGRPWQTPPIYSEAEAFSLGEPDPWVDADSALQV